MRIGGNLRGNDNEARATARRFARGRGDGGSPRKMYKAMYQAADEGNKWPEWAKQIPKQRDGRDGAPLSVDMVATPTRQRRQRRVRRGGGVDIV